MSARPPNFAMADSGADVAERDEARLRGNARALSKSAGDSHLISVLCALLHAAQMRQAKAGGAA